MYGFSHIVCAFFIFCWRGAGRGGGGYSASRRFLEGKEKGETRNFKFCACVCGGGGGGGGRIFLSHSVCARLGKVFFYWARGRGRVRRNASFFIKNCVSPI